MPTFELTPPTDASPVPASTVGDGMAQAMLTRNARWFTEVRWVAIGVVLVVGAVSRLAPDAIRSLGLAPPVRWPWIIGLGLVAANTAFCLLVRPLATTSSRRLVAANIWLQIAVDLIFLTVLVHIAGTTDSLLPCLYLLHIALACVFFGRRESMLVTLLAAVLYGGCVGLELAGVLPYRSIFADAAAAHRHGPVLSMLLAAGFVLVWIAVWYLVGTLSQAVRDRDRKLDAANRGLIAADERMNRQVLRTTHDLKAPFSGMQSNIQVLRVKHWTQLPEGAREILERIERRGQTLSKRIGDILLLGDLRSQKREATVPVPVDLKAVIASAVDDMKERADSRGITIDVQISAESASGDQRQFTILVSNLLSNAVSYSHEGGQVEVSADREDGHVRVSVTDHGIGISDKALPHVFDEYFRTKEAMKANAMSTGLGLAIVKKVAEDFGLAVRVTSEQGKGTRFDVIMPV